MRPISETKGFPVMGKKNIARVIPVLGSLINPTAILFVISLVIVYAVYLQALLVAWLHVLNEGAHIVPVWAYDYASASISAISFVMGFITAAHHGRPFSEKGMSPSTMFSGNFFLETAATKGFTLTLQGIYTHKVELTAIASAFSHIAISSINFMRRKHNEPAETLAGRNKRRRPINQTFHVNLPDILVKNSISGVCG